MHSPTHLIVGVAAQIVVGGGASLAVYLIERRRYNRERVRWMTDMLQGAYDDPRLADLLKPQKPYLWRAIAIGSALGMTPDLFVWLAHAF